MTNIFSSENKNLQEENTFPKNTSKKYIESLGWADFGETPRSAKKTMEMLRPIAEIIVPDIETAQKSYQNIKDGKVTEAILNTSIAAINSTLLGKGEKIIKNISSNNTRKIKELDPLHSKEVVGNNDSIEKLSDEKLLESVNNPKNGDYIKVNTKTGKVVDGNTRTYELKKRAESTESNITFDTEVKVKKHTPDNSEFWDM